MTRLLLLLTLLPVACAETPPPTRPSPIPVASIIARPAPPPPPVRAVDVDDTGVCATGSANPTGLRLNETNDRGGLEITWTAVAGVTVYELELDVAAFGVERVTVTGTAYSVRGEGRYRVRVRTVYCGGRLGAWSPADVITVGTSAGAAPLGPPPGPNVPGPNETPNYGNHR